MKVSQIYQKYYPPHMFVKTSDDKEYRVWAHTPTNFGYIERSQFTGTSRSMKLGINQLIAAIIPESEKQLIPKFKLILKELGKQAGRLRGKMLNWRTYDLWKEIENHPFVKTGNPQQKALEWYRKEIMNNEELFLKAGLLKQGFLYTYNYDTPKYESVLDFFDTQPLMISFGPIETSLGKRDIGINMHLFPPRIRRIILYKIFEMYRNLYKEQLFAKNPQTVAVTWKSIAAPLLKYGIGFGIRMYIPELRKNVIQFRYEHWASAIYLPSKRLAKTTQAELERLWSDYVKKQKTEKGPGKHLNESWSNS